MDTIVAYNPQSARVGGSTLRGHHIALALESFDMKKIDLTKKPAMLETVDTFMGAVEWTKNRMVIVYHRAHAGRDYIRLRTFNRHQVKGCWYPAPRFYMVPLECAPDLGRAILAAAQGKPFGKEPEWYRDFEKQYAALPRGKPSTSEPTLPTEGDTDS